MRQRLKRLIADNVYQMRTTTASPARRAAAMAVGVFLGCSPLYGLHIVLATLLARVLRLDVILVMIGIQVSYPVIAPFLYYFEMQVGAFLRRGEFLELSLAGLRAMPSGARWDFFVAALGDLALGSIVVGVALAGAAAAATYGVARRIRRDALVPVVDAVARPYVEVSIFSWEWVRAKLRRDPIFFAVLRRGLLPDRGTLVDVGCGRGVLLALLAAGPRLHAEGAWPLGWAPPPPGLALHGIEHHHGVASVARRALEGVAEIHARDAAGEPLPPADAVTIFDVLHYLREPAQRQLIARVAAALRPGGVLLVREADKAAGLRYHATHFGERLMALLRGAWAQRFHFRAAAEWARLFEEHGLTVEIAPMSDGTPFANVLLIGRKSEA